MAKDACKCLELKDDAGTICRELDEQDKVTLSREEFMGGVSNRGIICSVDSRVQSLVFVSESGLYDLIMQSRKPEAKAFKRWVTHEVLPSIRKTGSYSVQAQPAMLPNFCNPAEAARAWADLYEKNQAIELRALSAEAERDEAIRTKARIGSSREATAMATASAKSRECKRLETENDLLTTENSRLRQDYVENKDFCKQLLAQKLVVYVEKTLRDKCSKALQELSALMEIPRLEWKEFNEHAGKEVPRYAYHKDVCAELKQRILDNPKYLKRFK